MMTTITETIMEKVERTRSLFYKETGLDYKSDKKTFINWYVEKHPEAKLKVILFDLSNYYLFISEATIMTYLNEAE